MLSSEFKCELFAPSKYFFGWPGVFSRALRNFLSVVAEHATDARVDAYRVPELEKGLRSGAVNVTPDVMGLTGHSKPPRQTPHRPRWPPQGKRTSPVGAQRRSSTSWGRRLRVPYRDDGRRCSHWSLLGTGLHRHESVDAWPCDARSRGIREVRWREYRVCESHSKQNSCESATIEFRSDSFEEDRSLRTGPEGLIRTVSNDQRDPSHR